MNNKGFTLVELLATLVLLSIVLGITLSVFGINFGKTKEKTEEVFVETIKDALDMYLTSSEAKRLNFNTECSNVLEKTHGDVKIYKATTNFQSVIDSEYHPITEKDLVNPANEDVDCANSNSIVIDIYRDEDYVYYYSVNKSEFNGVNGSGEEVEFFVNNPNGVISNLPEGYDCE